MKNKLALSDDLYFSYNDLFSCFLDAFIG